MTEPDLLHRFLIEGSDVRGEIVHLDHTWRSVAETDDYPPEVRDVLGQAVSALALLAATIKFDGSISLQISGDGPLHMLVVQCSSDAVMRGLARWRGDTEGRSFADLLGQARLMMTIDPGPGKDRYQGIVAVDKDALATVLQEYFELSEQLPTRLWLAADQQHCAGLLLQRLPGDEESADAWDRVSRASASVTDDALLQLPVEQLLTRVFARETLRLFPGRAVSYGCSCSRERVRDTLRSLGRQEFTPELEEQRSVFVDCEFCNRRYQFDVIDLTLLFANDDHVEADRTRH